MQRIIPNGFIPPIILFAIAWFNFLSPDILHFPDTYWHIAAGDYIREHGIPLHDPWSHSAGDARWYNLSWSFDVVLSMVHERFGYHGLEIIRLALAATVIGFLFRNIYSRNVSIEVALIATFLCGFAISPALSLRPHLLSFILALIFHFQLQKSRQSSTALYVLPLLTVIWANFHGSVLVGLILIGSYGLESIVHKNWTWFKQLFIVGVLCFFAMFLTPLGWHIIPGILRTLDSVMKPYISEWQPIRVFSSPATTPLFAVFLLVTNLRLKDIPLADKIITFGFVFMGLDAGRNFSVFALLAAPYIALSIASFKPHQTFPIEARAQDIMFRLRSLGFSVLVAVVLLSTMVEIKEKEQPDIQVAVEFALEHYPERNFLNGYGDGGQLIYYSKGKLKIFVDGRADTAYSEEVLEDHINIDNRNEDWQSILEKYSMTAAILPSDGLMRYILIDDLGWHEAYKGKVYSVLVKE